MHKTLNLNLIQLKINLDKICYMFLKFFKIKFIKNVFLRLNGRELLEPRV